jgi:two-component system, NtrC family, response regulator AtoC
MRKRSESRPAATTALDAEGPERPPAPRFLLATANGRVHLHALPRAGKALLGRGPECEVVLDYASISRRHARLHIGPMCTLEDLGSRNGTLFRGQRLAAGQACEVGYGDSFSVGPVSLLLVPPSDDLAGVDVSSSRLRVEDPEDEASSPLLSAVARARLSVIIHGETGVGKEVLATTLHRLSGRAGPLLAVNCAALSESLLDSELFGHERGAFTGAVQAKPGLLQAAASGTLLLDEVGEMSPALQAKLLRALETRTVLPVGGVRPIAIDVRFLAATHRDLLAQCEAGAFRRDLFYRLSGFALEIPPLRERKQHIPKLALQILASAAALGGGPRRALSAAATAKLVDHDWPGNVRELRNVLERAVVIARGREIEAGDLLFDVPRDEVTRVPSPDDERARILDALEQCAGNQTRAALQLGISRTTLVHKISLHKIPRPRRPR